MEGTVWSCFQTYTQIGFVCHIWRTQQENVRVRRPHNNRRMSRTFRWGFSSGWSTQESRTQDAGRNATQRKVFLWTAHQHEPLIVKSCLLAQLNGNVDISGKRKAEMWLLQIQCGGVMLSGTPEHDVTRPTCQKDWDHELGRGRTKRREGPAAVQLGREHPRARRRQGTRDVSGVTGGLYLLMSSSPCRQHYRHTCCRALYLFMPAVHAASRVSHILHFAADAFLPEMALKTDRKYIITFSLLAPCVGITSWNPCTWVYE